MADGSVEPTPPPTGITHPHPGATMPQDASDSPEGLPVVPLAVRSARPEDESDVVGLWRACDLVASYNDPGADFRFAKAGACSDVLVGTDGGWSHPRHRDGRVRRAPWLALLRGGRSRRPGRGSLTTDGGGGGILAAGPWGSEGPIAGARDEHRGRRILRAPRVRGRAPDDDGEVAGRRALMAATRDPNTADARSRVAFGSRRSRRRRSAHVKWMRTTASACPSRTVRSPGPIR